MAKRKATKTELPADPAPLVERVEKEAAAPSAAPQPARTKEPAAATESYTVLARRYRPQQFDEVVGQEPVAKALVNALESNRVAHAYLFTGARGVGKTSTARILSKALNCERGPSSKPCGTCDSCQAIAAGEDIDVLEIDGASNRGIDEVRAIRQNVQYSPSRGRYKIYIVDEVHMLTPPAFNALLKTLEEPPPHVKFIFATTEVHKIPVTILSRCQRFDFVGIGSQRIVDCLKQVVAAEKMQADAEALELIARRAGGSMRDAQSLLDQLLAFGGQQLSVEQVHRLLGTASEERILALARAILEHDSKQALELIDQAAEAGLQLGELLDQLMDYWRDLMVLQLAGGDARNLSVSSRQRATVAQQAGQVNLDTILAGLEILSTTRARLRDTSHARIWLETALVRLSRLEDLVPLTQLAQWLGKAEQDRPAGSSPPGRAPAPERKSLAASAGLAPPPPRRDLPPPSTAPSVSRSVPAPRPAPPADSLSLTAATLAQEWPAILAQVGGTLAAALEKAGLPAISGPNSLVIQFPADYNAFRQRFEDSGGKEKLGALLQSLTGQKWFFQVETRGGAGAGRPPGPGPEVAASASRSQREEEALNEPLVKRAKEVLNASISQVEDGFGQRTLPAVEPADDAEEA